MISKKTTKNWRTLAFGPNFGRFVCKLWKKHSNSVTVRCWFLLFVVLMSSLVCLMYLWDVKKDVCIRLGVKDCTRKQKTDPKQRTQRSEISTKFVCRGGICLLQKCQMLPPQRSTRLLWPSTSQHLEIPGNSLIGWNPTAIARVQSLIARVHSLLQFFGSLLRWMLPVLSFLLSMI